MNNAIEKLGVKNVKDHVRQIALRYDIPDTLHLKTVCNVCCEHPDLAPNMNGNRKKDLLSPFQCIEQWVLKFKHGYEERISRRTSKMPGTVPDKAVEMIVNAGLQRLSSQQAREIVYAHRLAMSAENILGLLLEEFLFQKLSSKGWALAWGETIKSVDFCNGAGELLQIKNRSNSENSSSSKIRDGKPIAKWFRVNATTGNYEWSKLKDIVGASVRGLDEANFQQFIAETLQTNPAALAIEPNNPWIAFKV